MTDDHSANARQQSARVHRHAQQHKSLDTRPPPPPRGGTTITVIEHLLTYPPQAGQSVRMAANRRPAQHGFSKIRRFRSVGVPHRTIPKEMFPIPWKETTKWATTTRLTTATATTTAARYKRKLQPRYNISCSSVSTRGWKQNLQPRRCFFDPPRKQPANMYFYQKWHCLY